MGYTAVVLVGGVGTRLRPLTLTRPKPLIPLAGRLVVDRIIDWLGSHGFTRFILPARYLGHMIAEHYKGRSDVIVRVVDSRDTADAVRLVSDLLGKEDFMVAMGDVVCNANFDEFMESHMVKRGAATIALKPVDNPLHYGVIIIDESGRVRHFVEKPASLELYIMSLAFTAPSPGTMNLVNTGFYAVSREVLDLILDNPSLMDWGKHVFPYLLEEGYPVYGWVMPPETYWEDLGRPENYVKAVYDVLGERVPGYYPAGRPTGRGVYVGEGAVVDAHIIPPVFIGSNSRVDDKSVIGPYVSIEENSIVRNSRISHAIIWEASSISGAEITDSIIMDHVVIGHGTKVVSSIIGSNNSLGTGSIIYKQTISPRIPRSSIG